MRYFANLIVLFLSMLSASVWAGPANSCGFNNMGNASLRQISSAVCESAKSSSECQGLYKEMRANKVDVASRALNCTDKNLMVKAFEDYHNFKNGCAAGGWNFVKDSFISVGTFIGEGAAKAKETYDSEVAENKLCDADPNGVRKLYEQHNKFSVKALQIALPDARAVKKMSCLVAKLNIKSGVATRAASITSSIALKTAKKQPLSKEEKEFQQWHLKSIIPDLNLAEKAKQYLKQQGIKFQCYNARAQAEMMCEAIAEVASFAAGGAGAAVKGAKAAKIAEMAGVTTAKAAPKAIAATAGELAAAARMTNVERLKSAEKLLGRALTDKEKAALIDAHEVAAGTGRGIGTYTPEDLLQKTRILDKAGFSKAEREALIRKGLAGSETRLDLVKVKHTYYRLSAEQARSSGNLEQAAKLYKEGAQEVEKFIKTKGPAATQKELADAASIHKAAGNYDKAAQYYLDSMNKELASVRNVADRNEIIFERLAANKRDLRELVNGSNGANLANRKKYLDDERKMIESLINSGKIKFSPSHINELRR